MAIPTIKEIMDFSPFNTGGKEETPPFRRNLYSTLDGEMGKRYILAITGLRRVGKSTIIKQLLQKHGGAYFSFDEQRHHNPESLSHVIETFLSKGFSVIALDEIGNVDGWAGTLKKYHDQKKAKFIISGSAALHISKGRESLAGRMMEYEMPPFQFDEFLRKSGHLGGGTLWKMKPMPEELGEFLVNGSFPEIHGESAEFSKKYISSLAQKVVFEDIPSRFEVEYRSKLNDLLIYCASFSANLISDASVSSTLGISRGTVSNYLHYLSQSYLLTIMMEEGSYARALQKSKKVYVRGPSLYSALADSFSEGICAETAVHDRLLAWGKTPSFFRDHYKREIDFVVGKTPVEVKFRTFIKEEDFSPLVHYLGVKKLDFGIMVTKEHFDLKKKDGKSILLVPLSVFLGAESFETFMKP